MYSPHLHNIPDLHNSDPLHIADCLYKQSLPKNIAAPPMILYIFHNRSCLFYYHHLQPQFL